MHYPGAYGFIPSTRGADGNRLNVLVVGDFQSFTGALLAVRPIGILQMRDEQGADEKILGVVIGDPRHKHVEALDDLGPHLIREVDTSSTFTRSWRAFA